MAELTPDIAAEVLAACQAGTAEVAEALSRTLDASIEIEVGDAGQWSADEPPEGFEGPGLAVVLHCGDAAALFVLPESSGLLPEWYANPDPTGRSKLDTLAQELGMLLLPESLMPERFEAGRVADVRQALADGGLADEAGWIPLTLTRDGQAATAYLLWPLAAGGEVLSSGGSDPAADEATASATPDAAASKSAEKTAAASAPAATTASATSSGVSASSGTAASHLTLDALPTYIRSLLRVRVPVTATLARKKETLGKILDISPGTIIQFDKSCDELLDLEIGGQKCAEGEAVKVGDKFGIRITSIVLPSERFAPIRAARRAAERARREAQQRNKAG